MEELGEQARKDADTIWENELKNPFLENINQSILEIMESLDSKLFDFDKKLTTYIKAHRTFPPSKVELKSKNIEVKKINKAYAKLNLVKDANPLINLILQCLSNIHTFIAYYLNPEKEEKILSKSKEDPNGVYLGPSYMQLLKDMWGEQKEEYFTGGIHNILKELMKNEYESNNSGYIMEFLLKQFYLELNLNNSQQINLEYCKELKYLPNNKILNSFYSYVKTEIKCLSCKNIVDNYYSVYSVINIYLDENNGKSFNLKNNLNELLIERGKDKVLKICHSCNKQEIRIKKYICTKTEIIIFHIDRKNDPNYNISLSYENTMKILEVEYELITVIKDIPFNNNCSHSYIAYIRSFYNHKWFSYNNKDIKLYEDNNGIPLHDNKNASLLIYSTRLHN